MFRDESVRRHCLPGNDGAGILCRAGDFENSGCLCPAFERSCRLARRGQVFDPGINGRDGANRKTSCRRLRFRPQVRERAKSGTFIDGYGFHHLHGKEKAKSGRSRGKKILDAVLDQCVAAVEKDGADTIIIGCTPLQYLEDEIRQRLDASGYDEIQLICELTAAVEMAKGMVNMRLMQAPRAFPCDELKAKPQYR